MGHNHVHIKPGYGPKPRAHQTWLWATTLCTSNLVMGHNHVHIKPPLLKPLQHRFDVGETQEPFASPTYLGVAVCTRSRTISICNTTREKILDLSKNKSYTLRAIWRAVGSSNTPTMCWARQMESWVGCLGCGLPPQLPEVTGQAFCAITRQVSS